MTCLLDATQRGSITVEPGAALSVTNSTVNGSVTATSPSSISYCGSTENGTLDVTGATGPVTIGNSCASDTISGPVTITGASDMVEVGQLNQSGTLTLENDSGGLYFVGSQIDGRAYVENNTAPGVVAITVMDNAINGSLYCTGNNPVPSDNSIINTVTGTASDQCAAISER